MKKILVGLGGAMFAVMTSMAFAQAPAVEDAEIVSILNTANQGEIKAAKAAQTKATNPEVKKFADMMIADHGKSLKETGSVAKKARIKPLPNMYSRNLKKDASMTMSKLNKLQGGAFDQAYMDSQIDMHQKVLSMIDTTLLPNAKNAGLKSMITSVRPVIEGHLQQAKQIRSML